MMEMKSIRIQKMEYGENKGTYVGEICFANGNKEAFTFALTPEVCARFLEPIKYEVIKSAHELGNNLAESLKVIEQKKLQS